MLIQFNKMHGLGNDFVVLDGVRHELALNADQVRRIADRRFGVGCDQVLLVQAPKTAGIDFECRFYNASGDEAEQCGNGVRCVARFLLEQGLTDRTELALKTLGGVVRLESISLDRIRVDMGVPVVDPEREPFEGEGQVPRQRVRLNGQAV